MYLFELEDFNCTTVPSDWEDYGTSIRALYQAYIRCISNYIRSNSGSLPESIVTELNDLLVELTTAYDEVLTNLNTLIDELNVAPLDCFDRTFYTRYINSYNEFKSISQNIDILLTSGGDYIGVEPNISVESTTIYPTDGVINPKTSKCVGVYIKQMNNGSEFIGKVIDSNESFDYFYVRS
jgi:hypothetical protein